MTDPVKRIAFDAINYEFKTCIWQWQTNGTCETSCGHTIHSSSKEDIQGTKTGLCPYCSRFILDRKPKTKNSWRKRD